MLGAQFKLTAFNGQTITYDAIGNPTNDGTWNYTWIGGRQMRAMYKGEFGEQGYDEITFEYNENGLRTKKTRMYFDDATGDIGYKATNYTLHGKNIVHLSDGSNNLHFFYDAQNKPAVVIFNGTAYAYLYNLQGDVIGLVDSNGSKMVSYTYNAWGKMLSKTGTLANTLGTIQPFRYRTYVYDEETSLYYLHTRYYAPTLCRMLNSDRIGTLLFCNNQLANRNVYSYCDNNPVFRSDSEGDFWNILIGAVAGALISAAVSVATQLITTGSVDGSQVAVAAVGGAITGGFAATGIQVRGQEIINGVVGAASNIANYCFDTPAEEFDVGEMLWEGAKGAAVRYVAGKIGGSGTGSKHLTSSRKALTRALHKGKPLTKAVKYWYSQTARESVNCGFKAIPAIAKSTIPSVVVSMKALLY